MLTLLTFIFSGFWYFVGTVILMVVLLEGTADIVKAFRAPAPKKKLKK